MFRSNTEHVEVGMGHTSLHEGAQRHVRRGQNGLADFRILELALRVFWRDGQKPFSSEPAATLSMKLLSGVGDPEGRYRIVRRQ